MFILRRMSQKYLSLLHRLMDATIVPFRHLPIQRMSNPLDFVKNKPERHREMTIRDHIIAAIVLLAALLSASTAEAAFYTQFDGTRSDIREACQAMTMELVEQSEATYCVHNANGITVSCNDEGVCVGVGPLVAVERSVADDEITTGSTQR